MNLTIIGAGYVGLVGAVCFAKKGINVMAVEANPLRLNLLKAGKSPIFEENLTELLSEVISTKKLQLASNIADVINFSETIMLCVGTPQDADGQANLSWVKNAVEEIAKHAGENYKLIIEKSTVPINTHQKILAWAKKVNPTTNIEVASNPEFLREGKAMLDFMQPDRIVCGVSSAKSHKTFEALYAPFTQNQQGKILFTSVASAELIKQAANSFLAMKISYANMLAELCEKTGASIDDVSLGIGLDHRIGQAFLKAGIGFGGSCFPKDLSAFIRTGEEYGLNFTLLRDTLTINNRQRKRFINKIESAFDDLTGKKIAVWGLAFKPDTDDVREAPALYIIKDLLGLQATVSLYDPKAMAEFQHHIKPTNNVTYQDTLYEALVDADALVLLTEWREFIEADFERVKTLLKKPLIFDARNALNGAKLRENGFTVVKMGSI